MNPIGKYQKCIWCEKEMDSYADHEPQPQCYPPNSPRLPMLFPPFRQIYLNFYFRSKPTNEFLEMIFLRRTELAMSQDNHFNYKDVELWNGNKLGIKQGVHGKTCPKCTIALNFNEANVSSVLKWQT